MSVSYLRIIPTQPDWVPEDDAAQALEAAVHEKFSEFGDVTATDHGEIIFVDQGEGFEWARCPKCGSEIDLDWWGEMMDGAAESDFEHLDVRPVCCGKNVSLNDLEYHQPAGFARFVVEVEGYDGGFLEAKELSRLSDIAGFPLRQVLARY
jgi:hypothetical protein